MTLPAVAIAVPFAWTHDATYDVRLDFVSGPSPVDVQVANATYRMRLAGASEDFLRVLATAINDALTLATRAETCSVDIGASGLVTITCSSAAKFTFTTDLRDLLGLGATSYTGVTTLTGAHPPRDLYLFVGGGSPGWKRKEPIAGKLNQAGAGFGVRSRIVTWEDTIALEMIPSDPTARAAAGETVTPWEAGSSTLPWSCERLIETGLAKTCAFARHWQEVRASTAEEYDLVTIRTEALAEPDAQYQFPGLTTWWSWNLPLVRTGVADRS